MQRTKVREVAIFIQCSDSKNAGQTIQVAHAVVDAAVTTGSDDDDSLSEQVLYGGIASRVSIGNVGRISLDSFDRIAPTVIDGNDIELFRIFQDRLEGNNLVIISSQP